MDMAAPLQTFAHHSVLRNPLHIHQVINKFHAIFQYGCFRFSITREQSGEGKRRTEKKERARAREGTNDQAKHAVH